MDNGKIEKSQYIIDSMLSSTLPECQTIKTFLVFSAVSQAPGRLLCYPVHKIIS